MRKVLLCLLGLLFVSGTKVYAYDFQSGGIYYTIREGNNVAVTNGDLKYEGKIIIPERVAYNGKSYNVTSLGGGAFDGCSDLTSITIPNSVTSLGENVFYDCSSLESISIPNSIKVIPTQAFRNCSSLTQIDIPNTVTSIGGWAFCGCTNLALLDIPNSVNYIGPYAFASTKWFNSQPNGLVYAGMIAYMYKGSMSANTNITLKDGTMGIAGSAFSDCSGLCSIFIPSSVTSIGQWAFSSCTNLTSITIPNKVQLIELPIFEGCSGLTSIKVESENTIFDSRNNCNAIIRKSNNELVVGCKNTVVPNSVTSIGNYAFSYCTGLTSIIFPNSVRSIGYSAFRGCSGLKDIISEIKTPFEINENVFSVYSTATLTVPNGTKSVYQSTAGWNKFTNIVEASGSSTNQIIKMNDTWKYYDKGAAPNDWTATYFNDKDWASGQAPLGYGMASIKTTVSYGSNANNKNPTTYFRKTIKVESTPTSSDVFLLNYQVDDGFVVYVNGQEAGRYNMPSGNITYNSYSSSYADSTPLTGTINMSSSLFKSGDNVIAVEVHNNKASSPDLFWAAELITTKEKRTINVKTAGTLKDYISESDKYLIEELTLTGELNGTDFRLLRDMAGCNYLGKRTEGKLTVLDLTNAKIVAGGEKYLDTDLLNVDNIGGYGGNYYYNISQDNIIPTYVFAGCCLKVMQIPNSVKVIDSHSFWHCKCLTSITIPNSVTTIGDDAFFYCEGLSSITIPNSVTSIGNSAFYDCSGLTSITIPNSVTSIGDYAFCSCIGLTSISIPNSVTSIGSSTFNYCSGLNSIEIDNGNAKYDSRNGCNAIIETASNTLIAGCKNTTIPNTVTSLGRYAFYGCSGLTSIAIPNSVISIANSVFNGCSGLTSITIPNSVTSIGNSAFSGCSGLTSIKVESGNMKYDSRDGCNAIIVTSTNNLIAGCKNTVIPNTVTSLGRSAFSHCSSLTSIMIPNSVTKIGEWVFDSCTGLTSITIPNSVTSIGDYAFNYCIGLSSVISEIVRPFEIPEDVFNNSYTKATLTVPSGTKSAYQSTAGWNKFTNIVEKKPEQSTTITAKSYTREYGDANPSFTYTVSGGTISGTPKITCSAIKTSSVGTYKIQIEKGSVTNNNVTFVDGTLTITKAPLTITAKSYTRKQGEANPTFDVTYSGFKNNETSSVLTKKPTCSTTATANSSPGTYDITVSGASATNYNISYVKGKLTVTQADAIVLTARSYTREYGEDNPTFGYTKSGATLNGTPVITCSATKYSAVGTYPIMIAQGSVSNYNVTYVEGTLTITKAPLTITAKSYTRKQGEANPSFEVTYSGFKNGETASVLTQKPICSTTATPSSSPGTYDITVSGAFATNYDISYVSGKLTVTQADAVIVTARSYTREYGEANPTFGYTTSGTTLNGTPSITCSATKTSPVGTYPIKIAQGSVSNYNVTYVEGTLTITKAPLTITANSYTRKQGEANPSFDVSYSGFKNGETASVLTKKPTCSTTATASSSPGTYAITVSGASANNYDISYVNGRLTVTQADPVTVTARNYTREYGEANPSFGYSTSGATLNGSPNITCSATKTSPVGTYPIKIAQGSVSNYNVTYVDGTLTITKAPLTITAKSYTREEGQNNPTFEVTYSGFKNGETESVLSRKPSVSTEATTSSPIGTYALVPYGAQATNYYIYYNTGTLTIKEKSMESVLSNGIAFLCTNATRTAEVQTVNDGLLNVVIPSSISYNGKTYEVTSIANGALSNRTFDYVSLPSTVTSISSSTFYNSLLGALIWNANASLASSVFSNMAMPTNSNFLLYVNSKSYAPSNVSNVVVGNTASSITLQDGIDTRFYCPKAFTAQKITYTHHYGMTTGGNGKGWETIAMPFDVQRIEHKAKGVLTPFVLYYDMMTQRPFWLYEFGTNGFRKTDAIRANTPYIIAMPNDPKYDDEYILAGDVTFSATNASVYETAFVTQPTSNGKTFVPAFAVVNSASSVYALNVNNNLISYYGSYDAGSRFISNLRAAYPFEAYMTTSSSSARFLTIEFEDEVTGIDEIPLKEKRSGIVRVYTLTGLLLFSVTQSEFTEKWQHLPSGVYIVNGKKMIKSDDAQYNIVY